MPGVIKIIFPTHTQVLTTLVSRGILFGIAGPSTGGSLPPGGETGQVLKKLSDDDGDAGWLDETGASPGDVANWNAAYSWGNHASAGYALASAVSSALAGKQPLDGDLTAIAGLSSNGLARRTGTDTWVIDSTSYIDLAASRAGITFTTTGTSGPATYNAGTGALNIPNYTPGATAWGSITGTLSAQTDLQSALNLKAPIASPTFTGTVSGITKAMVGLGNVDNTADASKPVSTLQAAADAFTLFSAQAYADSLVIGLWDDRGSYNASGGTYPSTGGSGPSGAINKGDVWTISVAGTVGPFVLKVGDIFRALVDTPGTTSSNWAAQSNNIGYVAENTANKDISGGYVGLTAFKINFRNAANTFTSFQQNSNTAARTYTFQDRNGTIADDTDITAAKARGNHTGTQTASTISDFTSAVISAVTYNIVADFVIPVAANQTAQGPRTNDLNAGATIAIMELLILDNTSKWQKTDANTAALYAGLLSMALAAGTNGNPLSVALPGSIIRNDSWAWTPGATLYMSETPGEITETAPTTTDSATRVIGFAIDADNIYFNPSPNFVIHT